MFSEQKSPIQPLPCVFVLLWDLVRICIRANYLSQVRDLPSSNMLQAAKSVFTLQARHVRARFECSGTLPSHKPRRLAACELLHSNVFRFGLVFACVAAYRKTLALCAMMLLIFVFLNPVVLESPLVAGELNQMGLACESPKLLMWIVHDRVVDSCYIPVGRCLLSSLRFDVVAIFIRPGQHTSKISIYREEPPMMELGYVSHLLQCDVYVALSSSGCCHFVRPCQLTSAGHHLLRGTLMVVYGCVSFWLLCETPILISSNGCCQFVRPCQLTSAGHHLLRGTLMVVYGCVSFWLLCETPILISSNGCCQFVQPCQLTSAGHHLLRGTLMVVYGCVSFWLLCETPILISSNGCCQFVRPCQLTSAGHHLLRGTLMVVYGCVSFWLLCETPILISSNGCCQFVQPCQLTSVGHNLSRDRYMWVRRSCESVVYVCCFIDRGLEKKQRQVDMGITGGTATIVLIICLHTVKLLLVLLSNTNSFICTQLNGFKHRCVTLTVLFN